MKLDRMIAILSVLLQKEKVTAPYLAERFEVSRRTIIRDIDALCMAGTPIVTEQGHNGGISIMENWLVDEFGPESFVQQADRSLLFTHGFTDKLTIICWITSFGKGAELIEPVELRQDIDFEEYQNDSMEQAEIHIYVGLKNLSNNG